MADHNAEYREPIRTEITEWAVRCRLRDGGLHTGNAKTERAEAVASGERLTAINGADWWLVSRQTRLTVERSDWVPTPPASEVSRG